MIRRIAIPSFSTLLILGYLIGFQACKHDPILGDDVVPVDPVDTTSNPVDTTGNPVDTTSQGMPCKPDIVYFELDVLPILRSNCALSGCHDEDSAQDGVILTSYANVVQTGDVEPFRPDNSDLYEVIVDDNEDDRMPPAPRTRLTSQQISLIAQWILQGAKDETCDPNAGGCDSENVSFANLVQPVIQTNCLGCHSGSAPSGGIALGTHAQVAAVANSGALYGAISWAAGYSPMPQGASSPLPACTLEQIKSWIDAGTPNN